MEEELIAEGTELAPTEPTDDIAELRAMIVELQGQFANMQATLDAQAPIEAAAEGVEEEPSLEGDLLEEEPAAEPAVEEVDELDKMLHEN